MTRPQQSKPRRHRKLTAEGALPGEPSRDELVARMIRVNQAGEFGAVRIYDGQLAVLGGTEAGTAIREMAEKERAHLEAFDRLIVARQLRPTVLSPLWHLAGFALGVSTALMGERAAMACTVAVEDVIDKHYAGQAEQLGDDETELRDMVESFRADELAHRETSLAHGALDAPGYEIITTAVKAGSRLAIWLSTRL